MRSPPQQAAASRTLYYELLGVEKHATDKDIKRAYHKKALKLHPDKGGDEENFKKMKHAHDVLLDPKKRKAYDQYGEPGVQLAEGNFSMEAMMHIIFNLGSCERLGLVLLVTIIIGYLLLFPILLSHRWDHPNSMTFAHVFIPIWLALGVALSGFICCMQTPSFPDLEEEDDDVRKEYESKQQEYRKMRWGSVAILLVLTLLLLFLVLRLDGETKWSYFLVIWPWILLELGQFCYKFWTAESFFLITGHDPEIINEGKWMNKEWNTFMVAFTSPHLFYIAFACLLALKQDGALLLSWWEVFMPLWAEWTIGTVVVLLSCGKLKSLEELSNLTPEARMSEDTYASITAKIILRFMWLGLLVLLCFKLSRPSAFPAWIIFLPAFMVAGCFCCCLSCVLCCATQDNMKEAMDEENAAGDGGMYGTMR
jgi:hypothetical protein